MGDLKGLVLLFMFLAATDVFACKPKGSKIKQTTAVRQDYLENPDFEKEFPQTSGSAKMDYPDELILPLNVYLSPSWRKMFKDQEGVTKAKEVLSYVKEFFIDDSLSVKMLIVYEDMDIVPHDEELSIYDIKKMENFISEPRQGRAAIVYLTTPQPGLLGYSYINAICGKNKKKSRSIVQWSTSSELTAKTVAHEIGHNIGMSHDFAPTVRGGRVYCGGLGTLCLLPYVILGDVQLLIEADIKKRVHEIAPTVRGGRDYTCGPGEDKGGPGNQLMNYKEPMENSWSDCSNVDFKEYYNRVLTTKAFCLKEYHKNADPRSDCMTDSGASPDKPCIFPFKFAGQTYNQCTWVASTLTENKPWCSTMVYESGEHIGQNGLWGYCAPGCPRAVDDRKRPVTE